MDDKKVICPRCGEKDALVEWNEEEYQVDCFRCGYEGPEELRVFSVLVQTRDKMGRDSHASCWAVCENREQAMIQGSKAAQRYNFTVKNHVELTDDNHWGLWECSGMLGGEEWWLYDIHTGAYVFIEEHRMVRSK